MRATRNLATRNKRMRKSLLRLMVNYVCSPAFANYTPTGPGSLATGQAGAAGRGGRYVRANDSGRCYRQQNDDRTHMEFSMPLRQVFWT
ncbi:MAG: hypothetical protein OEQ74_05140 [Gammaproteobacteria bacterium]|nr:hypothetical protein [Gammaproteobacteria bacterium]